MLIVRKFKFKQPSETISLPDHYTQKFKTVTGFVRRGRDGAFILLVEMYAGTAF